MSHSSETSDIAEQVARYYEQHRDEMVHYVYQRILHAYESEDIVQDVILRLLSSGMMVNAGTLPCLLYTMLRHSVADWWRRKQVREQWQQHATMEQMDQMDPQRVYEWHDTAEAVEHCMNRLTAEQRKVYMLSIYDGLPVREISRELQCDYKYAENRLSEARRKVRHELRRRLA